MFTGNLAHVLQLVTLGIIIQSLNKLQAIYTASMTESIASFPVHPLLPKRRERDQRERDQRERDRKERDRRERDRRERDRRERDRRERDQRGR